MYQPLKIGELTANMPIVQGGMGVGISLERLASAVAKNGGVGILSGAQIGYREENYEANPLKANLEAVKKYVRKAKELADGKGIIGINIMVATKFYEKYVKAAVDGNADLIVSGAGLPVELPMYTKGSKTKIAPVVSSEKAARILLKMWDKKYQTTADMIVIEGPQAGGHLGFKKDEIIHMTRQKFCEEIKKIKEIVRVYEEKFQKKIPIVAGGGITTKEDVASFMDLGIDGVQVGTRFVTTTECDASDEYKQCYLNATKEDIEIIDSPVGMPGRAIHNIFLDKAKERKMDIKRCYQCIKSCDGENSLYCISRALVNAVKGDIDNGLLFCGANAYKADKIETVQEVMEDLMGQK